MFCNRSTWRLCQLPCLDSWLVRRLLCIYDLRWTSAEIHNSGHWEMSECSSHLSPFIFTKNNSHHSCCLLTLLKRYDVSLLHSVDSFWFATSALGCVHSQMKMESMNLKNFLRDERGALYIWFWCYSLFTFIYNYIHVDIVGEMQVCFVNM